MNSLKALCGVTRLIINPGRLIVQRPNPDFRHILSVQQCVRHFAKGKDKKKENKGKSKNIQIQEQFLSSVIDYGRYVDELQKALDHLKEEYSRNMSVRSATGSLETLKVPCDGNVYTLIEISQIIRKSPKSVIINMDAFPQLIPHALKAITASGMNLSPQQDGTTLHVPIPKMSKEYRESLAKGSKSLYINSRDTIKQIQNNVLKDLKSKEKDGLSQDISQQANEQVKMVAEKFLKSAETLMNQKQEEILNEKL